MAEDAAARRLDRLPRGVWLAAGSAVVLLMGVASRYGFHRDELYFVVAGRRLDWGYVDQPPLTPLVARFSELVGGTSPVAVRVVPALAVGAVAVMAATMARRFGGGRAAQVFAAFTAGWTGVLLGEGHLLSTAVFDHGCSPPAGAACWEAGGPGSALPSPPSSPSPTSCGKPSTGGHSSRWQRPWQIAATVPSPSWCSSRPSSP
jgi:hypothetical protein